MTNYTVKAGDTLASIARQFLGNSLRYPELAAYNRITNPNLIRVGQTISIPDSRNINEVIVTAKKIPDPYSTASDAPLPGVFELEAIEGTAQRDWIIPAIAAGVIYMALRKR